MSAYVIVDVETSDPQRYEEYKRMAQESVARFGGRYIVRGGKFEVVEGEWRPTRLVVLEFDSFEEAREWWGSQDYSPAKALRQRLSRTDIVIVDGT
ncbi:MAG TPA: DUF1330 domain-containing protein [Candidatus Acidoferrales bacterium]|jgi:uncharacterized protein (DUF1330 family)|nr:DUF1330 domain-containing protein [Candidatus Acidoferrales bacterium]